MDSDRQRHQKRRPVLLSWLTALVLCLLCVCHTEAQYAKSSYFMDADSDCYISGYLLIRTDEVVNIMSRNPGSSNSDILRCTVRFKPDDDRDITDVSFTHMTISDRGVTLRVDLSGAESLTLRAGSPMPRKITAKGSQVTVSLSRLSLQDREYSFGIIIRVYTEDNTLVGADEKPVAVGMVVGIVAGVIVFLICMVVIIVCCYRRKREQYRGRGPYDPKVDLTSPTHTSSSSPRFGLDNAGHDGIYPPREGDSPPVKKKPLPSQTRRPPPLPQDSSDPESDSREEVVRNGHPVKPAAFRNENERNRSNNERNTYNDRNRYNDRNTTNERNAYNDRNMTNERNNAYNERNNAYNDRNTLFSDRNRSHNEPGRDGGRRRPPTPEKDTRPQENSRPQKQGGPPPKSPLVSALHSNPRFRASFHATEQEAEKRAGGRMGGGGGDDPADDSDVSMTETWNTTFDTNFDDDPRPPAGSFIKPPTLPPVPMSPREPVRRENVAGIHRAPRPSSSSSEMDHLQGEGGAGRGVSMNPDGEGPPSPSEIVPIRVQDPHSPSIKRKANAQQARRPRDAQDMDETRTSSADSQNSQPPPPTSKPKSKKATPSKSKPKPDAEKKPKSKKPVEAGKDADEVRNKPRDGKTKPKEPKTEYEGRFKKSDSVRKSKSRSPRIGRSRSTGTGLEDADSIGQPSTPRGSRAVPRVTADDYEDSDVESNYNPLRRTGSKNSLYASRSSLYARRRRKNSLGESVYSLAFDDAESERPTRDSFKERRLSRRDRNFRSLGDLEVELRDQETRSTQTLRECATQTGAGFTNVSPGKKITAKKSKPGSVSSSHTQTARSKTRNLDSSSSSSGVTKPRERRNSASSLSARSKSRDRANSASAVSAAKARHRRTDSEVKSDGEGVDRRRPETPRDRPKPKPKPKARKGPGSKGRRDSDDDDDDDLESIRTGMTGPLDHSSAVGRQHNAGVPTPQAMYPPQAYPSYPAGYPAAHTAYMQATGQPPMMVPYPQNTGGGGGVPPNVVTMLPNPNAAVSGPTVTPSVSTARPPQSKWDALCRMTNSAGDAARGGDWNDSASVAGSVLSNPYMNYHQPPPALSSALSDYGGSEVSGPARSVTGRNPASRKGGRSAWDTLREMTDQESQYAASESNV